MLRRSPIAISRLSLTDDGLVQYRLKRPWPRPGSVHILSHFHFGR